MIHLPHLTLYFPPSATQVLARIVLSDLQGVHIRYETHVLSSPGRPGITLRRGLVGKVLGPTYESGSAGDLVYPGVSFQLRCQALDAGAQADSANPAGIGGVGRDEVVERIVLVPKGGDEAVRVRGVMRCELRVCPAWTEMRARVVADFTARQRSIRGARVGDPGRDSHRRNDASGSSPRSRPSYQAILEGGRPYGEDVGR